MTTPTGAFRFVCRGLAAVALVALIPVSATAQSSSRPELQRVTGTVIAGGPLTEQPQTVVLKMTGDPVAVVRSRTPGKQLAESERQSIERDLRSRQDAIVPSIQRMGGTVLGQFQHAINGIKVSGTHEQIRRLATLPGVVEVKGVRIYHLVNAESVPFIGAPQAWQGPPGLHGEHIRIAVIDTGVDYTHANFGGPGTVDAWTAAFAHSTEPADPALFGSNAPKVKGGTDLVGDNYDPISTDPKKNTPMPDPNPLDCAGHGSHTSGTATGFGVTSAGKTFQGSYDAITPTDAFIIGPGVAPLADLYAVRVFGCTGGTRVVVDAIDWAVAHDMQVISMSLGADFGTEDDADAEASENAVNAGIMVVASSGNSGTVPYVVGNPSTGEKAISVAAMDSHASYPGEALALAPTGGITALDSNGIVAADGTSLPVVLLPDIKGTGAGGVSLGCDPAEYTAAGVTGKLVVTVRGSCSRVARAIFGQQAGAAAVAMINSSPGYPPYEGQINSDPDNGLQYTVTIPFLGVQGPATSTDAVILGTSTGATLTATTFANPTFGRFASFSSAGPRGGDGHLKPDISAPGVSIFSTGMGTGSQGVFMSGTSMAAPHVAGSAALTIQAHPDWDASDVAAAIVNTADATKLVGYSARLGGNGLVQPFGATQTSVIAHAEDGTPSVSFGVAELTGDFSGNGYIVLENRDSTPASFALSVVQGPGAAHTATVLPISITLAGHQSRTVAVRLAVPAATVGDYHAFRQVQGRVVMTPTNGNNGVALSVPYYLVPRARSLVEARLAGSESALSVGLDNRSTSVTGTADFYAWGLRGHNSSLGSIGLRAVGVQSFTHPKFGQMLVFAVNTFGRTSNPVTSVYDVLVDVNGDGVPDYLIRAADLGRFTGAGITGKMAVAVFNLATGAGVLEFLATAPTDGSTVLMPLIAADAGITATNPRFSYTARARDVLTGNADAITSAASFNAFNSSISTGAFVTLPPGTNTSVRLMINPTEFQLTPAMGQMVVSLDNRSRGGSQALLLSLGDD
jgi:subtilisin family serine protease